MAKPPQHEMMEAPHQFNYGQLKGEVAQRMRLAAQRIREKVKKTLEDIIAIGQDLLAAKGELPHGQFSPWLKTEFGWTERSARNFMAVAERFGKTEMISDLRIQPTAAYLLAAPSTPDEARQAALDRAAAGEKITTAVARDLVSRSRKRNRLKRRSLATDQLQLKLMHMLGRYRDRWQAKELPLLAHQLRVFADALDKGQGGPKHGKA